MTADNNLDQDILECRAEILQALGKTTEEKNDGKDEASDCPNPGDLDREQHLSQNIAESPKADSPEFPVDEWLDDSSSKEDSLNGTSFFDPEISEEGKDIVPAEQTENSNPIRGTSSLETEPAHSEPKTLIDPKDLKSFEKIVHTLKEQKKNLSQTCQEQEKHIAQLTEELHHLRQELSTVQQTHSELSSQTAQLRTFQEEAVQLQARLERSQEEMKHLEQRIHLLEQENRHLLEQTKKMTEELAFEQQNRQAYNREMAARQEEINTLKKQNEDLQTRVAQLNQETHRLREEKSSLYEQVHLLEQGIARQQTDFQQTTISLREDLQAKTEQVEYWKAAYQRLNESVSCESEAPELECQSAPSAFAAPNELEPTDKTTQVPLEEKTEEDFSIPDFDLSVQILSSQRRQSGARRQGPPDHSPNPNNSVRNVVRQFISNGPILASHKPVRTEKISSPDFQSNRPFVEEPNSHLVCESLISEIVRRDIEQFCRNHQSVYVEFPFG